MVTVMLFGEDAHAAIGIGDGNGYGYGDVAPRNQPMTAPVFQHFCPDYHTEEP